MAWTPSLTDLGSVNENVTISHTITYIDDITALPYPVTITVDQVNPNTIVVSGNILSGYYKDSFNNTITYRTPEGTFPVVTRFNEIDLNKLYQIISYKASPVTSKTFTYTAKAMDGTTVLSTQVYSKTVTNDWTEGKNNLQTFVGYTT
jgi:hypothetical protein